MEALPNHVHIVVEPIGGNRIGSIVHSWKSFSAKQANQLLGRNGPLWHRDYFDRFIRDEHCLALEFWMQTHLSEPEARGPEDYEAFRAASSDDRRAWAASLTGALAAP